MIKKLLLLGILLSFSAEAGSATPVKTIVLDGSTTVGPVAKSFAAYFTRKYGVRVSVSESGSGNGAKSLINGSCTIATLSRPMKDAELAAARTKGVNPVATVVAMDGLAIVVHPANPVRALTKAQISSIYTGRITNWKQIGGPNANIVVIQRESNSGTAESFKDLVVGKGVQIKGSAETQSSNGSVKSRVSSTPTAIGYLGLGFVDRSVKAVAVNGVLPDVKTVRSGSYPVARPLYFYTNGQPAGVVKQFVDLPKTTAGKGMISELGFVNR
ncbi:phosphate ABC transporter substrate-binding protein [Chlorobium sp. BLA1]|uniref:phosphate ABC transporter substrate-binding protein n=1 Tax=Candidatus Chlorobium masyuteum TaxID=2716876 RepID=UPI00142387D5|nr:phosphate ABC transporter substrate-binding protein [Candidatus Chlorobium masyuteum]NHQ61254.1 phosphate ABC transporter substrate-binding protein [Candidatus Chlorobium masyuteum]NTU45820.1 phosphate ABC transporter substrate-binding protein [Chlorobiaceae bacterium]